MSWVYRRPPDVRQRRKKVPPSTRAGGTTFNRTVNDDVDLTDDTSRVHDAARTVDEAVGVTDSITAAKTINVEITDAVGIKDATPYFLDLPGTTGHYVSTPDHVSLDITDDLELRVDVQLDSYNSAALIAKWDAPGDERSYLFTANTSRQMELGVSSDGSNNQTRTSTFTLVDGTRYHLRVHWDASASVFSFFYRIPTGEDLTSDVGWIAAGTPTGSFTSIFSSTAIVEVGTSNTGTSGFKAGERRRAIIYDGIGGTIVANFEPTDFFLGDSDTDTAVDSTGKTWTINGASSEIKARIAAKSIAAEISDDVAVTDVTSRVANANAPSLILLMFSTTLQKTKTMQSRSSKRLVSPMTLRGFTM